MEGRGQGGEERKTFDSPLGLHGLCLQYEESRPEAAGDIEDTRGVKVKRRRPPGACVSPRRLYGLIFTAGFFLFHGLYPLRHFVLYPGNPSWHEEGHFGETECLCAGRRRWNATSVNPSIPLPSPPPFLSVPLPELDSRCNGVA